MVMAVMESKLRHAHILAKMWKTLRLMKLLSLPDSQNHQTTILPIEIRSAHAPDAITSYAAWLKRALSNVTKLNKR